MIVRIIFFVIAIAVLLFSGFQAHRAGWFTKERKVEISLNLFLGVLSLVLAIAAVIFFGYIEK